MAAPTSSKSAAPDWIQFWPQLLAHVAGRPPFEAVYTGPAWETSPQGVSPGPRVWKVAVLERRPGGGADHWGHLFLIHGEHASGLSIRPEGDRPGDLDRPPLESLAPIDEGLLEVRLRPLSAQTAERLRSFAREVQRQAVQQMHWLPGR